MIPGGIVDNNVEIFANGTTLMAMYNGNVVYFRSLPIPILKKFMIHMFANAEAMQCLNNIGYTSINSMLERYCWCRFGGFDGNPDMITDNGEITSEYWDCGKRNNCPYEFKLCNKVWFGSIYLTRKEVEVVKLIASGYVDKVIADKACISLNTLLTHKKNIYTKLSLHTQTEITAFAFRHHLIS